MRTYGLHVIVLPYTKKLVVSAHIQHCFTVVSILLDTLYALRGRLLQHNILLSKTRTDRPQIEENIVICIHTVARG
jgi:hypothetical protein